MGDKSVDDKSISFGGKSYMINNTFYPTASTSTNSTCSNLLCVDTITLVDFPEISKSDGVSFDQMIRKDDTSVITWYGEPSSSSDGVGSMNFVQNKNTKKLTGSANVGTYVFQFTTGADDSLYATVTPSGNFPH